MQPQTEGDPSPREAAPREPGKIVARGEKPRKKQAPRLSDYYSLSHGSGAQLRGVLCSVQTAISAILHRAKPFRIPAQRMVLRLRLSPAPLAEDSVGVGGVLADARELLGAAPRALEEGGR